MIQEGDCIKSRNTNDLRGFIEKWGSQFGRVINITKEEITIHTNRTIIIPKEEFCNNWVID